MGAHSRTASNSSSEHNRSQAARLEALHSYRILDTPPESDFDQIATQAAQVCDCPMAMVNLLDANRQWFKARVGISVQETDLALAMCTAVLRGGRHPMMVTDATAHPQFAGHPFVINPPHIRFYACVPLVNPQGYTLGTLAVMHHQAHQLSSSQMDELQSLADHAIDLLEVRRQKLRTSLWLESQTLDDPCTSSEKKLSAPLEERLHALPDSAMDAMWDWNITTDTLRWNEGVRRLLGISDSYTQTQRIGWEERIHPEDHNRVFNSLDEVLQSQSAHWTAEYRFMRGDESYTWVLNQGFVLRDDQGQAVRMVGSLSDITYTKEAALQAQLDAQHHAELLQVQQRISSLDMPLKNALQLVAQTVLAQTQASGATVEFLEGENLIVRAAIGHCARPIDNALSIHKSLTWPTLIEGKTFICNDIEDSGFYFDFENHYHGISSVIASPLQAGGSVVGKIKVTSSQKNAFSQRHIVNMEILAASLGTTIQLRHVTEKLITSEQQYRTLFDGHPHPMWVYENESRRIIAVNQSMVTHYGYSQNTLLNKTIDQLLAYPINAVSSSDESQAQNLQHILANGKIVDIEIIEKPIIFNGKSAHQVFAIDITDRLANQRELARMNRAQKLLSACNETLVRANNENDLLEAICDIAVNIGGYKMGWVGYAQDDEYKTILPIAQSGDNPHYLDHVYISWSPTNPQGRGPAGTVIRTGKPVNIQDINSQTNKGSWIDRMRQEGFYGVICLPLIGDGRTFGVFYLYAPEILHISSEESNLLQELANDLAFGIMSLRAQKSQKRLQDSVLKMAAAVSANTDNAFFFQLAQHMTEALNGQAGCVAKLSYGNDDNKIKLSILGATFLEKEILKNTEYILENTPCLKLLNQKSYLVRDHLSDIYPLAPMVQIMEAKGYAGHQLCNTNGEVIGIVFVLFKDSLYDVDFIQSTLQIFAARAEAEINQQSAHSRIRNQASWLDKAQDAIVVLDLQKRITFWNKSSERLYGWSQLQILGQSDENLLFNNPSDFQNAFKITTKKGEWSGDLYQRHRDGHAIEVESRWTLIPGEDGESDSILVMSSDISQRKATEREIQRLAFYDPLTGLPNRMLLMDRMQKALFNAQRRQTGGALLFIDMDNFKTLNDTLGHDQGDLLLQQVAQRLNHCIRAIDTVARLGGDEFVVMLEELSPYPQELAHQARSIGEKIVTMLAAPYTLGAYQYRSTPSIGIAPFDSGITSIGDLLKQADLAMYQAKTAGRNTLRFFNPEMQSVVTARAELETDLRSALTQEEFLLYYQVQVNASGECIGAEALLRWNHPDKGMVPPGEFIALAEETGLILSMGRWVLHTACKMLSSWQNDPSTRHLTMAVNVSSRQFKHAGFVEDVARVLAITGAPAHQLKLELTESMLVEDMDSTIAVMTALKEYGVCFSLDDFGTGYSSLSYLRRMPLSQLKIDQSFVRELLTESNDAVIVNTIIGLSRSLGLTVIAEGVETPEQHAILARYGCELFQGYLFGRPIPAASFQAFLNE